jgi:hypothetical protein
LEGPDVSIAVHFGALRWVGREMRREEYEVAKRILISRPDRRRGKEKLMWIGDVGSDL